jgi:predicted N-acetyltransferase YhbS
MTSDKFSYRLEQPDDSPQIEALHAEVFGPGRFARAAYRLREGVAHDPALSFVAHAGTRMIASVRMTEIAIGDRPVLLLGPLVVLPDFKGRGAGKALVRMAVRAAGEAGHKAVMLVGDADYYGPLGFTRLRPYQITLPGPVDPSRVLVAGLVDGALDGLAGRATRRPGFEDGRNIQADRWSQVVAMRH